MFVLLLTLVASAPGFELPVDATGPEETLHYDTAPAGGFAVLAATEYYAAVRFTPVQRCTLKAVLFYQFEAAEDGRVYVYGQNSQYRPGAQLASKSYSGAGGAQWKRVNLDSGVVCDSGVDFWTAVRTFYYAGEHPLGVDQGPLVRWRGGYIKVPEMSELWYQLTESPFFEDRNWNQRAIVVGAAGVEEEMGPEPGPARAATVVRGTLRMEDGRRRTEYRIQNTGYRAELVDACGRRVMELKPGLNDVRRLAPGVYFVRQETGEDAGLRKVIVTR